MAATARRQKMCCMCPAYAVATSAAQGARRGGSGSSSRANGYGVVQTRAYSRPHVLWRCNTSMPTVGWMHCRNSGGGSGQAQVRLLCATCRALRMLP